MSHKFNPANMKRLDSDWRRKELPPVQTLEKFGLNNNDIFADIGCGIGYFTIPAAKIVNSVHSVYALDTSEEMLTELSLRATVAGVSNIKPIQTEEYDLKLPDETISFALIVNVIHEIKDKPRFLLEVQRILKPKGHLVIIDWEKKETDKGPPLTHRISKEEVADMLKILHFEDRNEKYMSHYFYGLAAIKI